MVACVGDSMLTMVAPAVRPEDAATVFPISSVSNVPVVATSAVEALTVVTTMRRNASNVVGVVSAVDVPPTVIVGGVAITTFSE
jgi:hypothetical protein